MYTSTRDNYDIVSAAQAIKLGMVPAGGLFVPEKIPCFSLQEMMSLRDSTYQEIAQRVLTLFLDDYTEEEIQTSVKAAYNEKNFNHPLIAPLKHLREKTYVMELWHGPTAAFKDMALQIMPHLLSYAKKKVGEERETVILVATSGDTGKAALEGFKDVPGVRIIVFYPHKGVSKIQELQMTTTSSSNTFVVAVKGNFDDCQNAVKKVFSEREFGNELKRAGIELSSANSINWGRLLPQIVYYINAYMQLLKDGKISFGEKINFVVPTGNFGNILAAWYALQMGLPINKLICASNENKVLTDFFNTGRYDRNRGFVQTTSPSMDILISSNLERFLYEMSGHDGEKISAWMQELAENGGFRVDQSIMDAIGEVLAAGYADEIETKETIGRVFSETGYTLDTHTAVGMKVYEKYLEKTGDSALTVVDATASPFKFNNSVLQAIAGPDALIGKDEYEVLQALSEYTGQPVHPGLRDLDKKPVLHRRICTKEKVQEEIKSILNI